MQHKTSFKTLHVHSTSGSLFTGARQSASDRGTAGQPLDRFGSGQSLAYDLFLVDLGVHVCGSRLGGQDKIGHGDWCKC